MKEYDFNGLKTFKILHLDVSPEFFCLEERKYKIAYLGTLVLIDCGLVWLDCCLLFWLGGVGVVVGDGVGGEV